MICDKIISDLNCNIIVNDKIEDYEYIKDGDEFLLDDKGNKISKYVYIYILQLNKTNEEERQSWFSVRLFEEDEQIVFKNKEDGYYTLCTIKIPWVHDLDDESEKPPYFYSKGRYYKTTPEKPKELDNLQELVEVNPETSGLEFTYDNYFSVCHLRKCFIKFCQDIFNSRATVRCEPKFKDSSKYNRDLVWAALTVIQYLVDFEQYQEAQRILERISGCNGLCKESKGGGCGCK